MKSEPLDVSDMTARELRAELERAGYTAAELERLPNWPTLADAVAALRAAALISAA